MSHHHSDLIAEIEAFTKASEMSEITFGRKALGDPHFVRQLRNGRRVWPTTEARVRKFIADNQSAESSSRSEVA